MSEEELEAKKIDSCENSCGCNDHQHEHDEHEHHEHDHDEHECGCCHDEENEEHEGHEGHEEHLHHEHKKSHGHHHCCCHDDDDDDDDEHGHHHEHGHSHGGDDDDDEEEEGSLKKIIISAVLFVLALLVEHLPVFQPGNGLIPVTANSALIMRGIYLALYFGAYIISGLDVLKEAVEGLFHGEVFGEEFLMSVATLGAVAMGEFSEAVAVMLLFGLGEFLEDLAVGKSRKSITDLMDIRPDKACVKRQDAVVEVMAQDVKLDEVIVVKPGERIPLDGIILKGTSLVDTSALTGESVPREVLEGNEVLAGFVNASGTLEIRVTKEFGESTVSRVLEMVENSQSKKAKTEKFIRRFSKVYTPVVCLIALLVAVVPSVIMIYGGIGAAGYASTSAIWKRWIYSALEILVVSCPCALVISVPLSFFAGIGRASVSGILIKGSNYIEMLGRAKTVAFDKTGTLTKGVFEVTAVHPVDPSRVSADELLAVATHAEFYSNHPISRSLKKEHHCELCDNLKLESNEEISGHGIKCVIDGKQVLAGNMRLMEKENVQGFVPCDEQDAGTIIHVALDGWYAGHIVISDVAKDDAREAIEQLHKAGVKNTVMLTGDTESAAAATAASLGLDKWYSGLLPQNKVEKIEELLEQQKGTKNTVAFVGDGINDAPVLSRSDVGIAMGGLGSDAAIEAADVVIMDDMPSKVAEAVRISRKTMLNVKENVTFALMVKVVIMVLCALIQNPSMMWIAVFGDVGVTMLAVLNSMRLLAGKKKKNR